MMAAARPLAIVSAMHEELRALLPALRDEQRIRIANRHFHTGTLLGHPVVLVLSGIGKVAAASTATLLIDRFDAAALVFTGVAGGLAPGVRVGDVVIARLRMGCPTRSRSLADTAGGSPAGP